MSEALESLDPVDGANVAFVYFSDRFARDAEAIRARILESTGVSVLSGTAGIGVCCTGLEFMDVGAVVVLVLRLPGGAIREARNPDELIAGHGPRFVVAHIDPTEAGVVLRVPEFDGCYLVGGLTSSRGASPQLSSRATAHKGGAGVIVSTDVEIHTGLSQGCSPLGASHRVTGAFDNMLLTLDDRPALEVLMEDAKELTRGDPRNLGGKVFVGIGLPNHDRHEYTVRNLLGASLESGAIAIGHRCRPGDRIQFTQRDVDAAISDMQRMLDDLRRRAEGRLPTAGLYFSCAARGRHLFGEPGVELDMIADSLGHFPLVGFFGNGEICHRELYSHTGVLALIYTEGPVQ